MTISNPFFEWCWCTLIGNFVWLAMSSLLPNWMHVCICKNKVWCVLDDCIQSIYIWFWFWMTTSNPVMFNFWYFLDDLSPIHLNLMFCFLDNNIQSIWIIVILLTAGLVILLCCSSTTRKYVVFFWLCGWHKFPHWPALCCLRFKMFMISTMWLVIALH